MVKHLGSKKNKIQNREERDKNETRICRVLSLFSSFVLLSARLHFTFCTLYRPDFCGFLFGEWTFHINIILSQHLETRRLRTKSLSTRYSLLGSTQYSVSTHTHSEMRTEPNNRTDRATNSKWIAAPRKSGFSPTVSLFLDRSRGGERHSWWAQSPLANFFGDLKRYKKGGK